MYNLFIVCVISWIVAATAYDCKSKEFLQAGFVLYNSNNFHDAFVNFAMLSGVVGCEEYGLLGTSAAASNMGHCVAASHYFQLSHFASQRAPRKVIPPVLACLRHLGVNTHLQPASDLSEMLESIAETTLRNISHYSAYFTLLSIDLPTSFSPHCNLSSSIPPLNASIGIIDSKQAYPHDVAALTSQLIAIGATPFISSCEGTYDNNTLYIVLLPHNCSILPANYIGWNIAGDTSPIQATWSSSTLSRIFPRFIDINTAQLHCSTHSLGTFIALYV